MIFTYIVICFTFGVALAFFTDKLLNLSKKKVSKKKHRTLVIIYKVYGWFLLLSAIFLILLELGVIEFEPVYRF